MEEYLYHYMSLDTLRIILENKNFRFRNLSLMDDLEEGETIDLKNLKRFTYVSCWTESNIDTPAFWNYSNTDNGVRIRIKKNPFKTAFMLGDDGKLFEYSVGLKKYFKEPVLHKYAFKPGPPKLLKVIYTTDKELLSPTVIERGPDHHFTIKDKDIGVYKRIGWQEQREWRYRLQCFPTDLMIKFVNGKIDKEQFFNQLSKTATIDYIDLPLKDDAFDDIQILMSPHMNKSGKEELLQLINQHIPHATFSMSELKIRK